MLPMAISFSMATSDLTEMTKASISDNVNLLVYTGGCTQWQNSIISNSTNQIYQVKSGGVELKEDNLGSKPMTDPDTLSSFIKWCRQNYEASRYELICWDHGGGTLSGYGYDEKYPNDGSMMVPMRCATIREVTPAVSFFRAFLTSRSVL